MKQCIICGQLIRSESHICPTCGFRAELPFFLSAAQYEQWTKACAAPYREQWDEIHQGEQRRRSAEEKVNQLLQDFVLVEILREAEKIKTSTPKKPEEPVSAAASEPESVTETTERLPDGEEAPNLRDGKPAENTEPEQKRPAKGSGNIIRIVSSADRPEPDAGTRYKEETYREIDTADEPETYVTNDTDDGTVLTEIPAQAEPAPSPGLYLRCLSGEYAGAELELPPEHRIIMGRDPDKCNLIFSAGEISSLHCAIYCPQETGMVTILDYSRNGTYFADGTRLPKGKSNSCLLPCTIHFGRTPECFEISSGKI